MIKNTLRKIVRSRLWDPFIDPFADFGAIMMLHRVADVDPLGIKQNQTLRTSVRTLDRFLDDAKRRGFDFITLDELAERLGKGGRLGKAMVITLDDGYRDNFTAALPVFRKYGVPFTVNLATGLMDGEVIDWWDILERTILDLAARGEKFTPPGGEPIALDTAAGRSRAFCDTRHWIQKFKLDELDGALERLFGRPAEELRRENAELYLHVDELAAYRDEPLFTPALHTHHHFACEHLDAAGMRRELELNLARLATVGIRPRHFAFPYGRGIRTTDRFGTLFADLGIRTVSTTFPDVIVRGTDPMLLPRLVMSEFPDDSHCPNVVLVKKFLSRRQ